MLFCAIIRVLHGSGASLERGELHAVVPNPEKKSGEIECEKDQMLFCQSERRISDGRNGRNKTSSNVICQCGPRPSLFF